MTFTCIELTAEEFERDYPLQLNPLNSRAPWGDERGGSLFETYGEELDFVRQQNPRSVWTLIDGDDGDLYLLSGFHVVNRIGYLLSRTSVPDGIDLVVRFPVAEELDLGYPESEVQP